MKEAAEKTSEDLPTEAVVDVAMVEEEEKDDEVDLDSLNKLQDSLLEKTTGIFCSDVVRNPED